MKEEGAVVGRGLERELVAGGEAFRVGAQNGGGAAIELGRGQPVVAIGVALDDPRMPDQVERVSLGKRTQARDCALAEGLGTDHQCRRLPAANHDEPRRGIGDTPRLQWPDARSRAA